MKKKVMTVIESTRKAGRASMRKKTKAQRTELGKKGAFARWHPREADGKFTPKK